MKEDKKFNIVIPEKCEHTALVQCPVEPPHANMSISFTTKGDDKPFREGKILNRRCPEISGFLFRPQIVDTKSRKRVTALSKGDIVIVKVVLYEKGDSNTRVLSEKIQEEKAELEVT